MSRASERNRRFGRVTPPTPKRPERIKIAKGQPRAAAHSGDPLVRLGRDVATHGQGFVRSVLARANRAITEMNNERPYGARPFFHIHPTKSGPGRGTW